ncbi:MAG: glycine cleavage system aminomethyltransferase GcvT [Chitinispirillaceae bacterium]|nr:glycine cleavage system aminomethyltransferase GcvT [Chitinispirillaceae bacterium]
MKKTPFYEKHIALGAKMAPFGGYEMPIQYKGIIAEHNATRESATLFDTCHMGEFSFRGPGVVESLERIVSCPVETMTMGQCRYGFICNEAGGVIDDQILYRIGIDEFFMVVNAATEPTDYDWILDHLDDDTEAENLSEQTAKIDLQGPDSPEICRKLLDESIRELKYYRFIHNRYRGEQLLMSRTGYTGEVGFEFYGSHDLIKQLWDDCMNCGAQPAGLGARDTLRLEMGYPLYGHELDTEMNAGWSGFVRALGDKPFIGSDAVFSENGRSRRLCAISLEGRRTAHPGNPVTDAAGTVIGRLTSASFSPSLGRAIALGYIDSDRAETGSVVAISTERGTLDGNVATMPLYTGATGRAPLETFLKN